MFPFIFWWCWLLLFVFVLPFYKGEDALTTSSNQTENHVEQDWSFFYSLDEKLINHHQQQNNNGTSLKDEESTTTTSTTIVKVNNRLLTTTMATISRSSSRMTGIARIRFLL